MIFFVSKNFRFVGYKLRNQLAAIDFNMYRGREIATTADGTPRYKFESQNRSLYFTPRCVLGQDENFCDQIKQSSC